MPKDSADRRGGCCGLSSDGSRCCWPRVGIGGVVGFSAPFWLASRRGRGGGTGVVSRLGGGIGGMSIGGFCDVLVVMLAALIEERNAGRCLS